MISRREWLVFAAIVATLLLVVSIPYWLAWQAGGEDYVFGGFLMNPMDGNTYLAKMHQGFDGSWTFRLPYSLAPGEGTYINLFYLFLGHLARWMRLPLLVVYHGIRLVTAVLMLVALFRLCTTVFTTGRWRWLAFSLAAVGSGLGWIGSAFGLFMADLWVAEMYPFLAVYTNPHFPAGLAIQLWLLTPRKDERLSLGEGMTIGLMALLEAIISPFGIVVVLVVWGVLLVWRYVRQEAWKSLLTRTAIAGLAAGPLLVYYLVVSRTHPALQVWNEQNLTQSPPWWDLLLSLSPALLLALWGAVLALRSDDKKKHILGVWLLGALVLVYMPFSLQRRFLQGLFIPTALLAVQTLEHISQKQQRFRLRLMVGVLFVLVLPTNLVILMLAGFGIQTHDPSIYLMADEYTALAWIEENTFPGSVVLASPDMGLFLPAYTHSRVLYGHPYETVNAEVQESLVSTYFSGALDELEQEVFWEEQGVDYMFYGPREVDLGEISLEILRPVYESGNVIVYELRNE